VCCLAFDRGWIPPTLNFDNGDLSCDLDYVKGGGRNVRPNVCLTNSFGFGGINASVVLRRAVK
jgi:3-oxoacyl-[acyl-carrier-protein] synthase II